MGGTDVTTVPFSDFFPDRGLPSNFLLVRPTVFLNQLYICYKTAKPNEASASQPFFHVKKEKKKKDKKARRIKRTSRNLESDSSTSRNSSGRPNCEIKSAARSKANFLASPRIAPCDFRSNSGRWLYYAGCCADGWLIGW